MADFCHQCTNEINGMGMRLEDNDFYLAFPDEDETAYYVLCEGCGWTYVDREGWCLEHTDHVDDRHDVGLHEGGSL